MSNKIFFHSLEVVDRVSDAQLQVGENSDWLIWRLKGWRLTFILELVTNSQQMFPTNDENFNTCYVFYAI